MRWRILIKIRFKILGEEMKKRRNIIVSKKSNLKGEDGHKTFSIRIKDNTVEQLDGIAKETNRSRNEIINMFLEFAVANCEIEK